MASTALPGCTRLPTGVRGEYAVTLWRSAPLLPEHPGDALAGDLFLTREALGVDLVEQVGYPVDVAEDGPALHRWVEDSAAELGGVDVLVANVSALAIPDEEANWKASFDVDMMGTVRSVQAALPHLERSSNPAIVTMSSVSGREVDFAAGPYGSVKAAIVHYTQGIAHQFAAKGIRANSVSPGNVYFEGGVWGNAEKDSPDFFAHALSLNPTGRMASPREVARAVVFLASPAASFITGTNLLVDGALTRGVQL